MALYPYPVIPPPFAVRHHDRRLDPTRPCWTCTNHHFLAFADVDVGWLIAGGIKV